MHKHQRKKAPSCPRPCLVPTNVCSRSESASQEQRRRLTIMTITASDDGRLHPRDLPLAGGSSSCESGERIQEATVHNLCPHPVTVAHDRPTPPWVGAHLREAKPPVMSGPCRWGPRQDHSGPTRRGL